MSLKCTKRLTVMEAPVAILKGCQNMKIDTFPYVIGRCRTANFIITHINVSRNHCHIIRENFLWKIIDYSSSGTYVNDELVGKRQTRILKSGDVIRFGSVENNLCWTFSVSNEFVRESEQRRGLSSGTNIIKDYTKDNTISSKTFPTGTIHEGNKTNEAHQEPHKEVEFRVPTIKYCFSSFLKTNESHFGSKENGCGKIITEPEKHEIEIIDCKLPERNLIVKAERIHLTNENSEFQLNSNTADERVKLKARSCENQANITGEKSNLQNEHLQNNSFMPEKNENEMNQIKCYLPTPSVIKETLKNLPQKSIETNATEAQCFSKYLLGKDQQEKVLDDKYSCLPKRARMETDVRLETEQSRSKKTEELMKELEQLKSALNDLESKNSALEGELAAASNCKNEALQYQSDLVGNLVNLMEDELQCTICSELFVQAVTLSCTHTFCKFCIGQWRKKQKTCPICRKKIISETRSLVVDNYIDKMVENLSHTLKERREAIIAERNKALPKKKS